MDQQQATLGRGHSPADSEVDVLAEAAEAMRGFAARLPEHSPWRQAFEVIAEDVASSGGELRRSPTLLAP